jgi:hypothetical protein
LLVLSGPYLDRILTIPDDAFKWFIQYLDNTQGDLLREVGGAVSPVVKDIFQGTLDPSKRFGIEQVAQSGIMKHPKGSPKILEYINKTPLVIVEVAESSVY